MTICSILYSFGTYIFPVLVSCTKKNRATPSDSERVRLRESVCVRERVRARESAKWLQEKRNSQGETDRFCFV
jgi:hypothetical protein